jgi:RNA polymerase sigma factor (sigma-70 family)
LKPEQYNLLVDQFSDRIYHFLIRILSDKEVASDLTQDTFMQLWNHRSNVDPEKVKSWLFTTARNKALNYIKKNREIRWEQSFEEISENRPSELVFEYRDFLEQGFKLLTPEQRSLVLLRDLEGYDYKEIAELSGIPQQHVKARLFRARKRLKSIFEHFLSPSKK